MKAKPRREDAIQRDIIAYLEAVLPAGSVVYANANAARRTATGRAANGVPGLLPGIPDLSAMIDGGRVLYFEVKNEVGRLSEAQDVVIKRMTRLGGDVAVVRSIADVRGALKQWAVTTREAA